MVACYFIYNSGYNDFSIEKPFNMTLLILAGFMTVIPLFLFIKGLEKTSMATSGLIFFLTPTSQFLLGFFVYNEEFNMIKLISFIIIWIAVIIYLKDLYENNI